MCVCEVCWILFEAAVVVGDYILLGNLLYLPLLYIENLTYKQLTVTIVVVSTSCQVQRNVSEMYVMFLA